MKLFTTLALILAYQFSFAQESKNLVLNPSFENKSVKRTYKFCSYVRSDTQFKIKVNDWNTFLGLTPDIVEWDTTQNRVCVFPEPHSGNKMLGLINYHPGIDLNFPYDFHEIVQGYLSDPMEVGQTYRIEFYVQYGGQVAVHHLAQLYYKANSAVPVASNNLGFYFLEKPYPKEENLWQHIQYKTIQPHFNLTEIILTQENEWLKITGNITADKPYTAFLIGNFFTDEETETNLSMEERKELEDLPRKYYMEDRKRVAYYLLDDISVSRSNEIAAKAISAQLESSGVYTFQNVNFETAKWDLLPPAVAELEALANYLKIKPTIKVEIGGHTDNVGKDSDNQILSENRAEAVYLFLMEKGVSHSQLSYKGYGETAPVAENEKEKGRLKNRRVECVIQ